MLTRVPVAIAATTTSLLFLAGCSGGGSGASPAAGGSADRAAVAPGNQVDVKQAPEPAASAADGMSAFDARSTSLDSVRGGAAANKPESGPQPPEVQAPSIISKGTVSLQSDDVSQARFDLMRLVDEHQGQVSDEQTTTDDDGAISRSRLVLRVPSADFGDVMDALGKLPDTDLKSARRSSEDVTTQVIDNQVRVRAQKASIERIEQLLARARSLRSIVWIESQLTERQSDLDSLEQQGAYLADQTTLSTITVYLEKTPDKKAAATHPKATSGFGAGLSKGWHALTEAATAAATAVGTLLPFAVLLALVGVPLWWLTRGRIRPRVP